MIYFKDWEISHDGSILARQYDHLSRVLLVRGTPQGYDWEMRVRKGDWYETIPLSPMEGDVGCVLTEKHLALWGWYSLQLVNAPHRRRDRTAQQCDQRFCGGKSDGRGLAGLAQRVHPVGVQCSGDEWSPAHPR